ncbi:MAG: hypothetical protein A2445_01110 [Candidatus Jacksonbacteria bacterium RIFOXYC2_FULL_44_29]|nr:MAG: hypothetical protein UW45_C0056G0001 [Parcubacteria group bacterium GW2011_GWC2_44_22]OGY76386.1 MAG: hypothetical protein A2295_04360 [Candidatus Jacksonbacteria bacterium RIFOXYB2_FULL_44_15]OGY76435.1 MAG: hypothetical protein A2240_05415 [Candidatus Jacksonbacteria bacterium RIFOXYA2_FULL_43_12]OGY77340.1 MAG: hypothetical protein A2445_01110 [Candidatus Jacksonbacteria bacterium RIFOXYC2_FULL_44_29]OGY78570.1 MAG: hypothetical protein A2550_03870 [Candidatus Jacksonbacteria bacteri
MSERFGEQINPQKQFYTEYYKKETDDSPDDTRWSLACSFYDVLRRGALPNFKCLDIAAGTQKFELEFIRQFGDRKIATENGNQSIRDCLQFTTFDLAEIPKSTLYLERLKNGSGEPSNAVSQSHHLQADANEMPFKDNTFGIAVSNLALDFIGYEAIREMKRVLKEGGRAIINLHHKDMLMPSREELDKEIRQIKIDLSQTSQVDVESVIDARQERLKLLEFWEALDRNDKLFKNRNQILDIFGDFGFQIDELNFKYDASDPAEAKNWWWELVLTKLESRSA